MTESRRVLYQFGGLRLISALAILLLLTISQGCKKAGSEAKDGPVVETKQPVENDQTKDPSYLQGLDAASKFAEVFWKDRFILCGKTAEGFERWFSVEETVKGRRYLEIVNLRTVTVLSPRLNSADVLNRLWYGTSSLSAKAYRWCDDATCSDYKGGLIGVEEFNLYSIPVAVRNGVATTKAEDALMSLYKPTCEEIKNHLIGKLPYN